MASTQYGVSVLQGGQSVFGQTVETFHEREILSNNAFLGSGNIRQVVLNPSAENAHLHYRVGDSLKFKDNEDNPASPATGSDRNMLVANAMLSLRQIVGA